MAAVLAVQRLDNWPDRKELGDIPEAVRGTAATLVDHFPLPDKAVAVAVAVVVVVQQDSQAVESIHCLQPAEDKGRDRGQEQPGAGLDKQCRCRDKEEVVHH